MEKIKEKKISLTNYLLVNFRILFAIIIIVNITSCKKGNPNNFTLITSGYGGTYPGLIADPAKGRASDIVAARWGIDFYWRGCVISNNTEWEDIKNNWEAENNIEDKFGDDWKEKFNKEVEAEYQLEQKREMGKPKNE